MVRLGAGPRRVAYGREVLRSTRVRARNGASPGAMLRIQLHHQWRKMRPLERDSPPHTPRLQVTSTRACSLMVSGGGRWGLKLGLPPRFVLPLHVFPPTL